MKLVTPFWQHLNHWLDENNHEFGIPTAKKFSRFSYISYPISQVLFRKAELEHIRDFALYERIAPDTVPDLVPLTKRFLHWLLYCPSCSMDEHLRRLVKSSYFDKEMALYLGNIIQQEIREMKGYFIKGKSLVLYE